MINFLCTNLNSNCPNFEQLRKRRYFQTFELRTLKFGLYNHLKIDIVQTFELRTLKFGLYYPLMIYIYVHHSCGI